MGFAFNRCQTQSSQQLITPTGEAFLEVGVCFPRPPSGGPAPEVFCLARLRSVRGSIRDWVVLPVPTSVCVAERCLMRFHRPLTFALTMLPSADIVRTIKSFEPAVKTLIGTTEGTDQESPILGARRGHDPGVLRGPRTHATEPGPGTPVIVGEHTAVSEIFLEDELNGTVKSVDPRGATYGRDRSGFRSRRSS